MSSARKFARNLVTNWGTHVLNLVVMFFMVKFTVHTLGKLEYGIWCLVTGLTGYMGILDLGVIASTGRHVMLYLGKEDHQKVDHTIRTSLGFFSLIGSLILVTGLILGLLFPRLFTSVPPTYHKLVMILLPVIAMNVWFSTIAAVFSSVLIAHERFDIARGIDILVLAVRTAGVIVVLKLGYGLWGLATATVAGNVIGLFAKWFMAGRIYPHLRVWPLLMKRKRIKELMGYGLAAFVTKASLRIISKTDEIIVGAAVGVPAVTIYVIGATLVKYSSPFLSNIGSTFFPAIQRAAARDEKGTLRWLYLRQVRLGMITSVLLHVGLIFFGEPFIRIWMLGPLFPKDSVEKAATIVMIVAGSKLLMLLETGAYGVLAATGRIKLVSTLTLSEAIANVGFSLFYVLVMKWGIVGVAAGTFTARLLCRTVFMPLCACRGIGLTWSTFLLRIGGTAVVSTGLFALACLALRTAIRIDSWARLLLAVAAAIVVYIPIAFFVLAPRDDRKRVLQKLRRR